MNYIKTDIEGVWIVEPKVFGDKRGYFFESLSMRDFEAHVGPVAFVQDNESYSARRGVLRGLHFQKGAAAQAKLLRVVRGRVLDVAVDIRPGSPTFGRHVDVELSGENKRQFFIPQGFGHAFLTLTDDVEFCYKCDNLYSSKDDRGIRWNDPEIGIDWHTFGLEGDPILSGKDATAPLLKDSDCNFVFEESNI